MRISDWSSDVCSSDLDKTAEEHAGDGWFITGDIATIADDGRIAIIGRAKDLIIAGGYNIYPKEIELLIDAIPGVIESAVIGVPHPDLGEAVEIGRAHV